MTKLALLLHNSGGETRKQSEQREGADGISLWNGSAHLARMLKVLTVVAEPTSLLPDKGD